MTQKISIHRALAELKAYEDRIAKAIANMFVIQNKKSNEKIQGMTLDEVKNKIKGNFASVDALLENQKRVKAAVVLSNANTMVTIAGAEYTVAEAIERKSSIKHSERFLNKLKHQFTQANKVVEDENAMLPEKLENFLQSILGEKDKRGVEEIEAHTKAFEARHKYELIDPCGIAKKIEALEKEITDFKTEVDYVLSESNATTFVDVAFVE